MRGYILLQYIERLRCSCRSQLTFKADEVPLLFREPGVLTGYRIPNQSWKYYFLSVFKIHNETVNIWTHLIAFLLVLYKMCHYLQEYTIDDPHLSVYFAFGVCCLFYTMLSSVAHTIHSKSPYIHYTCYQADYAGIGFYTLGSSVIVYYASCHKYFYEHLEMIFLPVNIVMSWIGFICCCTAKLMYRRPYPFQRKLWQLVSFGTQILCGSVVIIFRYVDCWKETMCSISSLNHYSTVFVLTIISVLFFSSHFPEKIWPGKFDIVGQGHQIFHVLITVATIEQFRATSVDFKNHSKILDSHQPCFSHIFAAIGIYAAMAFVTIMFLKSFTLKRIRADFEIEINLHDKTK